MCIFFLFFFIIDLSHSLFSKVLRYDNEKINNLRDIYHFILIYVRIKYIKYFVNLSFFDISVLIFLHAE